jgi:thiol-disulfide isomerase/thioredoxin
MDQERQAKGGSMILLFLLALPLFAQQAPDKEQSELQSALAEAGSSKVDFIRALEAHLARYPQSAQRPDIERALVKAALEERDARRIVQYGEIVLRRDPSNIELLERVSRYLLATEDKEPNARALDYAKRLEELIRAMPKPAAGERGAGRKLEEQNIIAGKALVYRARAAGTLGKLAEAEALARKSHESFPSAESAREIARWLDKQGKTAEAIPILADAFMIADPNSDETDRAKDRRRLGEWYGKVHQSESGLGEIILAAYDRTQKRLDDYKTALLKLDPNANAMGPLDFSISGVKGDKLDLKTLKGKVVVFDFWATWCGPCRAQQPLYEQVKERFKENKDVVFLNVNTDENRDLVKPFLERNKWNKTIYFEDGLSTLLRVSSIPTTFIVNRRGEVASRMNGYIAERFVDMLSERITQSLEDQ